MLLYFKIFFLKIFSLFGCYWESSNIRFVIFFHRQSSVFPGCSLKKHKKHRNNFQYLGWYIVILINKQLIFSPHFHHWILLSIVSLLQEDLRLSTIPNLYRKAKLNWPIWPELPQPHCQLRQLWGDLFWSKK